MDHFFALLVSPAAAAAEIFLLLLLFSLATSILSTPPKWPLSLLAQSQMYINSNFCFSFDLNE
jgi:hypothetical protein